MISWGSTSTSPADGIERPLDRDVEALLLGARAVIGEIETLLDERIDVRNPALAGSRARVQQHVLDDRIGALAVLDHLAEVAGKQRHQFRRLLLIRRRRADRILQLIDELDRKRGEVVDEVQRVLDLVRDAGGQLAKRGELLGLDQPLLRGSELLQRFRQFPGSRLDILEQAGVLDRDDGLSGKSLEEIDRRVRKRARLLAAHHQRADDSRRVSGAERPGARDSLRRGRGLASARRPRS